VTSHSALTQKPNSHLISTLPDKGARLLETSKAIDSLLAQLRSTQASSVTSDLTADLSTPPPTEHQKNNAEPPGGIMHKRRITRQKEAVVDGKLDEVMEVCSIVVLGLESVPVAILSFGSIYSSFLQWLRDHRGRE